MTQTTPMTQDETIASIGNYGYGWHDTDTAGAIAERGLSEATVREAFTNQIGDLDFPAAITTADPGSSADFNAGPGNKWGWGLLLNPEDVPGARRAGSGAWAGLCNTHFWVDPASGITGAIYSQTLPFVAPEVLRVYVDFEKALYASLS